MTPRPAMLGRVAALATVRTSIRGEPSCAEVAHILLGGRALRDHVRPGEAGMGADSRIHGCCDCHPSADVDLPQT